MLRTASIAVTFAIVVIMVFVMFFLDGCAHPVAAPVVVCPQIKTYTQAEQDALAAALEALPPGNPLAGAVTDYGQLRAAARACHG